MNITEEHKQKARDIHIMLRRLEPQVLYCLADFMDFEGQSDEGMRSQCAYEAAELIDVFSKDGQPQEFALDMGLNLGRVMVKFAFQETGDGSYDTSTFDVFPYVKKVEAA